MPGKKKRFTAKEDRQAKHIADSEKKRGVDPETAKRIGYATVNKQEAKDGGKRQKKKARSKAGRGKR